MEKKKNWNSRVFESVGDAFDGLVEEEFRGDKGTCMTAACLLFLLAPPELRQKFVDIIKLAEGRGLEGSVLEAAHKIWYAEAGQNADAFSAFERVLAGIRAEQTRSNAGSPPRSNKSAGRGKAE